jgi:hypothetical protein
MKKGRDRQVKPYRQKSSAFIDFSAPQLRVDGLGNITHLMRIIATINHWMTASNHL